MTTRVSMRHWHSPLLIAGFIFAIGVRGYMVSRGATESTAAMVISSLVMFAACVSSAVHLLRARSAFTFVGIAVVLGWFFEETGAKYGWWFGHYQYTDVLGWRLDEVPVTVPLMWFALVYMGYVITNLIVWHAPVQPQVALLTRSRLAWLSNALTLSILPGMIVVAYDLGADPYMVHINAWSNPTGVMNVGLTGGVTPGLLVQENHAWFGETVQGFRGWFLAAYCIVLIFQLTQRKAQVVPASAVVRREALVPVLIYAGLMAFQYGFGFPVETSSIAPLAMGIPVMFALAGWNYWRVFGPDTPGETREAR